MTCDDLLDRIRDALKDRNILIVAKSIGVHYNTVRAIANGEHRNPTLAVLRKIEAYLART